MAAKLAKVVASEPRDRLAAISPFTMTGEHAENARRLSTRAATAVVEIDDSDSDSDAAPAARPKLRTRAAVTYAPSDDDDDEVDDDDGDDDDDDNDGDGDAEDERQATAPPAARLTRKRARDDEEAYEPQSDAQLREEEEADDAEELDDESVSEAEDTSGRRRSSRARKPTFAFGGLDDDFVDSRFEYIAKPRRERNSGVRKVAPKAPRRHAPKSKKKAKQSSESDTDDDFLASDDAGGAATGNQNRQDSDDENVFVIDKVIAREEHTLKEWLRICAQKNTRFLTNMSIFLSDDDEVSATEETKGDASASVASESEAVETTVVSEAAEEPAASATPPPSSHDAEDGDAVMEDANKAVDSSNIGSDSAKKAVLATPPAKPSAAGRSASTPISISEVSQTEERFLVKWKNLSYLHVSWETEKSLLEVDKNAKGKIQRFRDKELMGLFDGGLHGDEYFNPEFRIVDRILDIQDRPGDDFLPEDSDDEGEQEKFRYFYVKWKALPYDALTWEREDDVDDDAAVAVYEDRLVCAAARHKRVAQTSSQKKSRKIKFRGYSDTNPPSFRKEIQFELRDYQLTGVNWMLFNWYQHRNSMLADEMGLGKTVQTVTFINHLAMVEELPGPYLIIAPLSTLGHWQREFMNWTHLDAVVYHGSADARKNLQEYEFFLTKEEYERADEYAAKRSEPSRSHKSASTASVVSRSKRDNYRFDVLITTPEMCATADFSKLTRVKWQALVVDEAHRLKNKSSKLSSLIHKNFKYDNILLLTGTPLQNNVEELWTLLNFLDHERFDSMESFLERFGDLKDMSQVEQLHTELKPFLLRRMKEDVEKSLAPKEETIVEVELTVLQKQYYRAIYEMNTEFLARGRKKIQIPSLMNVAMELRKCCNHPFLIKGVEEQEIIRIQQQHKSTASDQEMTRQILELLVTSSGKLVLLDKLLPRLKENGHRVLIFSQFKIMLDILQDYLRLRSYHCERIDGNITGNDRQAAIDRFCAPDSASFIMLLSTRAGGVGINLTAADTVIIYDSDWNPQNDLQAQARCHRIGQKKSVKIYRLLTSKTYELHMFHQASLKLGLDQAVLGGIRSKDATGLLSGSTTKAKASGPSKEEIENLLKHGAYEIFREEKEGDAEAASKRFSEESIDQILNRSTKIIHDPKATGDDDGKKSLMSSFSKATFVSSTNPDEQVALDDPDFWTKVIGLQEVEEKPVEPSPLKKRRRRPVKSYLLDDSDAETGSKRATKKPKPIHERDNDEYVISDESDESDDDDLDDLVDEEFGGTATAKRKKEKSSTPPISLYTERIGELLATFGYGRWDDMVKQCRYLASYPLEDLQAYTQQCIARCVHIAAGTALANNTPTNTGEMPEPLTFARKVELIDNYASRFSFLTAMLRELGMQQLSMIQLPKNLRLNPASVKAQREANSRVQQIDRMFLVQTIIRSTIGAPSPMVALINDLQQLRDRERVREVLESGLLPDSFAPVDAPPQRQVQADGAAEGSRDSAATEADGANSTTVSSEVGGDGQVAKALDAEATVAPKAEATVGSSTGDAADPPTAALDGEEAAKSAVKEATIDLSDDLVEQQAGDEGADSKADDPECSRPVSADSDATVESSEAPLRDVLALPDAHAVDSERAAEASGDLTEVVKSRLERKEALRRLRGLPDIGFPDAVAPWWLPVLDDVILLFYVYKDGWFKGRTLPSQLVTHSSLFSTRSAKYPITEWPTVAVLTKRVKSLVSAWTNAKKLRLQLQMTAAPPKEQSTSTASRARSVHDVVYGGAEAYESDPRPSAPAYQPTVAPFSSAKHNRFAKIVFAFGIPDTRTCRDDHERLEKWRYFIQDDVLRLARRPLVDLLAEALDLERYCRLRTQSAAADSADPQHLTASMVDSILGGKRGFWQLTSTQCRRLLQRVDLFRLLRTQILVLPPEQLVDVVTRVVALLRADPSKNEFPRWWSSPRHDILLLQGVECYGLDEYLSHVWKLPLFSQANPTTSFPNTTWAENYVNSLALRCRRALLPHSHSSSSRGGGKSSRSSDAKRSSSTSTSGSSASASAANKAARKTKSSAPKRESEVRQRIRDIQGMRAEDPHFTPEVRDRQVAEAAEWTRRSVGGSSREQDGLPSPATTADVAGRTAAQKAGGRGVARAAAAEANDREKAAKSASSSPPAPRSASAAAAKADDDDAFEPPRSRQQSIQDAMKQKTKAGRGRLSGASTRAAAPPPTMRTRTRPPRTWDVIVIDESDDE